MTKATKSIKSVNMIISLRQKKLSNGRLSLFLEYNKGNYKDAEGKTKRNRDFEYLKLYILEEPKTPKEKQQNKETMQLAENILAIRQADYVRGKFDLQDDKKQEALFLDYYNEKKNEFPETEKNHAVWSSAQVHLEAYCPKNLNFAQVDESFVRGFKSYLDNKARTKSDTPLAQNTKYAYYNKFKACINSAFNDGYITSNPIRKVKGFAMEDSQREYLLHEELQALANTECKYPILKQAFLFSCLTGLRWSDIQKLTWSEIRDEKDSDGKSYSRVTFRQEKTDGLEYLYIPDQARAMLGERREPSNRVFYRLKYSSTNNSELVNWCSRAGITKHITFHCARHTCAVLMLENDADLYTVSKFLGHKELKTTQIYAKIIDRKMREASNVIPMLDIRL